MRKATQVLAERLRQVLEAFKLHSAAKLLASRLVEAGHEGAVPIVLAQLEAEAKERPDRKRERLLRASHLPPGKTFETFDRARLPRSLVQRLDTLAEGQWVEEGANVLAFGLPGVGKSHAAAALGHALVDRGYSVLFTPTFRLVQELLAAKRDLKLPRALRKLDLFDVLALDDIGYVQQAPEEVEVLFTLMAERYERRKEQLGGVLEEKKLRLQQKWEHAALRTRLRELEYSLKMQRKRLGLLMQQLQLQAQPA